MYYNIIYIHEVTLIEHWRS